MSALPSIGTTPCSFSPDETLSILKRARDGDKDALPDLHEAFSADPDLINRFGDTAAAARKKMLRTYYGDNLLAIEATKHWIERTARQLAGESPSPIERLLADRASTCWFAVSMYEVEFAAASTEPMTASQADALQKQIDRAHRRLLTSLKALAAVRRVPVAALQVNIARVNVEAPAMAEEEPAPDLASLPASHGVGSAN